MCSSGYSKEIIFDLSLGFLFCRVFFVSFYRAKNAMGKYIPERVNKRNKGSRLCKCSVYLGQNMFLNRDVVDTAYTLSPAGVNARGKLGKQCNGTSSSQLPNSLAQVHRYTRASRHKHQLFIFQHIHLEVSSLFPCAVRWKGDTVDRRNKIGLKIKRLKFQSKSLPTSDWIFSFDLP